MLSVLALLGLAVGNLYQKKHCTSMNLFTGGGLAVLRVRPGHERGNDDL
jgi:hypothetical protein